MFTAANVSKKKIHKKSGYVCSLESSLITNQQKPSETHRLGDPSLQAVLHVCIIYQHLPYIIGKNTWGFYPFQGHPGEIAMDI